MKRSLNQTLIETTIRNAIKQIKDDPERNIRNLVDMALTFSNGRFQQLFFNLPGNYCKTRPVVIINWSLI